MIRLKHFSPSTAILVAQTNAMPKTNSFAEYSLGKTASRYSISILESAHISPWRRASSVPDRHLSPTDSHANIMGSIGAFGQGMGDQDIAAAFANGSVWFKVPASIKVELKGMPTASATAKDVTLAMCKHFGANGLLGYSAELYGPYVDKLDVAGRMTLSSMCTEMGGIAVMFPAQPGRSRFLRKSVGQKT